MNWIELNWIELNWIELKWISPSHKNVYLLLQLRMQANVIELLCTRQMHACVMPPIAPIANRSNVPPFYQPLLFINKKFLYTVKWQGSLFKIYTTSLSKSKPVLKCTGEWSPGPMANPSVIPHLYYRYSCGHVHLAMIYTKWLTTLSLSTCRPSCCLTAVGTP